MDLRGYYRKLRQLESSIESKDVYVMSLATPDGGREGVLTQAPRRVACQLVVEGRARLATTEEAEVHERETAAKRAALAEEEYSRRIHVQLVAPSELTKRPKRADQQ